MADHIEKAFFGSVQTVINSATDIAAGAFGGAGTDFTNDDAAVPNAFEAEAMIEMPDWAAAPAAGAPVQLWGLPINVDGTDDVTDAPSGAAPGGAVPLCTFILAAADALQRRWVPFSLEHVMTGFTPYVFNGSAQNMNNDGGTNLVVKIRARSRGTTS